MHFTQYSPKIAAVPWLTSDPGWRRTGSNFSPLVDAFHRPFPLHVEEKILCKSDAMDHDSDSPRVPHEAAIEATTDMSNPDPLSNLPAEVSAYILSFLSPAALDAARHTCKHWRQIIMSNEWVLSAVINHNARGGRQPVAVEFDGDATLRKLLRSLDRTVNASDNLRMRFRIRNLEFEIAEANDPSSLMAPLGEWRAAVRTGIQCGFFILQIVSFKMEARTEVPTKTILVFFRFDSQDTPLYAGSAGYPESEDPIDFLGVTEAQSPHSWILKIGAGEIYRFYSIASRKAFSKSESSFSVTELGYPQVIEQLGVSTDENYAPPTSENSVRLSNSDQSRGSLAPFQIYQRLGLLDERTYEPRQQWSGVKGEPLHRICAVDRLCHHDEAQGLAEHVRSENVLLLKESNHLGDSSECTANLAQPMLGEGTTVLLQPYSGCICRNVAIAPAKTRYEILRVAIIWQSRNEQDPRSELYIYDVPEATHHDTSDRRFIVSLRVPKEADFLTNCNTIQGNRVTSLNRQLGGIHSSSRLWDLATTETARRNLQKESTLGGLQLPQSKWVQSHCPDNMHYQKCFVWGPVRSGEAVLINCKIIDFSFADRRRPIPEDVPSSKHSLCTCALHDDGLRIVLPPIKDLCKSHKFANNKSEKKRKSSFWPWKHAYIPREVESMPVITQLDSRARQEAVSRETEWFKERIRCMKEAGLSDFDVAELWGCSTWTDYGRIRRPEGWQDL